MIERGAFAGLRDDYGLILADPPWRHEVWSKRGEGRGPKYATMTQHQIARLPVGTLAARDCHLMMWVTNPILAAGLHIPVMTGWGFRPTAIAFVWVKPLKRYVEGPHYLPLSADMFFKGMGHTTRQNVECVVLGRRGRPRRLSKNVHQVIIGARREHSRKPEGIHALCEAYGPGPYLELFARERFEGWDAWGDQVGFFAEKGQPDD